jgi:DNA-binding NarL/FixJ family response regulator
MCMNSKTIVLWGREDLLSTSVELFLTSQKGWNVVNISSEDDFEALIQAVEQVHPDVVIIHQGDRPCKSNLPTILLKDHPGLKVITVSLNDNLMEVYSKQNILVKSASDLISVVEATPDLASQQ